MRSYMLYYAFFDKKAGAYLPAWPCSSTSEALRAVQLGLREEKATWSKFPADFDIYVVGEWNPTTGILTKASENGPMFLESLAAMMEVK